MIVGAVARRQCPKFDRSGSIDPILNVGYSARLGQNTHWSVFHRSADKLEFSGVKCYSGRFEKLSEEQTADKVTNRKTIRLGHFVDMVGSNQAARADHVFDNDRWIA